MRQALLLLRDYEQSGQGWFWSTDAQGRIDYISDRVAATLGKPGADLVGTPFSALFILDRDQDDTVQRTLPLILSAHKTFSDLALRAAADGDEVWWSISGRPQFTGSGQFLGYRGNGSDITEVRRTRRDVTRLAEFDALTGLANRHRMSTRLSSTLAAYKVAKRSCAVLMIDLDRFKQINDTQGHAVGDELLKQVADRLRNVMEEGWEIGRFGGDEFQAILPDVDDRGQLGDVARKIIAIISQPYSFDGTRCVIGASVGVAIAPYDGINSEEVIRSADLALYAAKDGGRGQFRFYSTDLHSEAERRRRIEEDLRDAVAKGEIGLAYQPLVDPTNNTVVGVEAVMRWQHPELGELSPGMFIPIAEESNLIVPLGDWALKRACEDMMRLPGNLRLAVNISPAQFANLNLPATVMQALASSGLSPDRLELEVTESIFIGDSDRTDAMFTALKQLGVRLALDDFGTGYSSLGYLRKAPFDKIKIDKTFITGITEPGTRNGAIIKAIVSLAEALDMDTTAEGIEAHDELDLMRSLRVKQVQGFIYSRALALDAVLDAMESGEWVIEPNGPGKSRAERMSLLRKVGLIHEDFRYDGTMRNLSRTGCLIEGLLDVPVGTQFVVDFGGGQIAVAVVRRVAGSQQGLEFETPLVDDGAGGLVTRNRVSPYLLAAAGMPLAALPPGDYPLGPPAANAPGAFNMPKFAHMNESGRKAMRLG